MEALTSVVKLKKNELMNKQMLLSFTEWKRGIKFIIAHLENLK
jgi:hypothetical protein